MTETLRRGYPGMKSVKDMPVLQDGPPPGGFPSVRYARRIPSTGPGGFTIFAGAIAIMAYGFYKVGQTNIERRAEKMEVLNARKTLYPVLQAEEDRRWTEVTKEAKEAEREIMSKVPGWDPEKDSIFSVYSKRWMPLAKRAGVWGDA